MKRESRKAETKQEGIEMEKRKIIYFKYEEAKAPKEVTHLRRHRTPYNSPVLYLVLCFRSAQLRPRENALGQEEISWQGTEVKLHR